MKTNISTLIACDKLPVRTTPERRGLGFAEDPQGHSYLGDLKCWGNIIQKMQKITKNMIVGSRRKKIFTPLYIKLLPACLTQKKNQGQLTGGSPRTVRDTFMSYSSPAKD